MAEDAHSPTAPAFIELSTLERVKCMAYWVPLLRAWIGLFFDMQEKRRAGTGKGRIDVADRKQPGRCWLILALAIVVRRRAVRGRRGTPPRFGCGKCHPALQPFSPSFPSLCSILRAFLVEQSSLFCPFPSFLLPLHLPVAQSYPASRLKSTSLCVPVATFHSYSSLLPHPPSNKAPSHKTDTPTS